MGSAVNPFLRRLRSDALNWRRHSKESILKVTGHRTVYRNEKRPVRGVFIGILAEAVADTPHMGFWLVLMGAANS